jgi:two-component system OmpR family sensor kinase
VNSIRSQVLVSLLSMLLLIGLVATAGIYLTVEAEFNELFDYELRQVALSFRDDSLGSPIGPPVQIVDAEDDLVIQIWDHAGALVYVSDALPVLPPRAGTGFSSVSTPGTEWRVFNVRLREHTIEVGQPMAVRHALAAGASVRTLLPMLFLIAGLGIVIWIFINKGLRPLKEVARAVEQRSAWALQPLADADLPDEVRPLVLALNQLLARLGNALQMHRTFIADAAHGLRTPLAAIQLQIQLARRASSERERAAAFEQLDEGVKRAAHLVQQLLDLARHGQEVAERPLAPVELSQLARQAVADHASIAHTKDIDIGIDGDPQVCVQGDFEALRVMLGNLVDNAIRYTQRGGRIDVGVRMEDDQPVLTVQDNGPGISAEFRERAFDRFSRKEGSDATGNGLGLAIVKNIALRHRASIALESSAGASGLRVMVRFPAQTQPLEPPQELMRAGDF